MVEIRKILQKTTRASDQDEAGSTNNSETNAVTVSSAGWISPRYTQSRVVRLDWDRVEANRIVGLLPNGPESEYYKMLRIQIQQRMEEKGWNTLMITSVGPSEGKTLTAINLAAMFAREYSKTVLLVDADLQQQQIHRYLGYPSDRGLVDFVLDDCPIQEVITWPQVEKFTVISGGRLIDESTEVLCSPRMKDLVWEIKSRHADRYVFFDLPPLLNRSDAMAFSALVDGIIIVVESGRTAMPDINKALAFIPRDKFLGFVMNREG
jgi:protein-tyrosine kinase